jgi:hypothetical protein
MKLAATVILCVALASAQLQQNPTPAPNFTSALSWTGAKPDPTKPLGGYKTLPAAFTANVHLGTKELGTYNHNIMMDYLVGQGFFIQWKNCDTDEDCNGQRMLYSKSADAKTWSKAQVLFPNMTTADLAATLEPGPAIHVNGKIYAAASPGVHNTTHDSSAQGSQFCLWPDPINPRNCGPPSDVAVQYSSNLLMREVLPNLGEMFWQSAEAPALFAAATKMLNIKTIVQMDSETQKDIMPLTATDVPCESSNKTGTLKCEACKGGCQLWNHIPWESRMSNERTHWELPGGGGDVIAYRSEDHYLWATVRRHSTLQSDWPPIQRSDIPNDSSNLNGGSLPDGRVYLVHNPVTPSKKAGLQGEVHGSHPSGRCVTTQHSTYPSTACHLTPFRSSFPNLTPHAFLPPFL